MRKFFTFILAIFLATPTTYASTTNIPEGMANKAIRGAVNLFTGIVEVPMQTYKGYNKGFKYIKNTPGSKAVGTILGLFRGFGHAGGRMSWGGMELFGFWAANPEDNQGVGVPFDAQYAWEQGEQYSIFQPSFAEGVKPIGQKFIHGVANGFGGIAEVPGQIKLGISDGNALKGAGKGFWFWWSREIYGFNGIFSSLVPNPSDNPGYPFNGKWPWSALLGESSPASAPAAA